MAKKNKDTGREMAIRKVLAIISDPKRTSNALAQLHVPGAIALYFQRRAEITERLAQIESEKTKLQAYIEDGIPDGTQDSEGQKLVVTGAKQSEE